MPRRPMPTPPIYEPEVAARAIWRATIQKPRELWVGGITPLTAVGHVLAPGLMDRVFGRVGYRQQQSRERRSVTDPDNLYRPVDDGGSIHGRFGAESLDQGSVVEPLRVRMLLGVAGVAAIAGATAMAMRARRADAAAGDYGVQFGLRSGEAELQAPTGAAYAGVPSSSASQSPDTLSAVR